MEKVIEQNTYVLQEDDGIGTVKIADDVVAIIAGLAATEVEGVVSMAGNVSHELMSKMDYAEWENVRLDVMKNFGYFSTESNGHLSEYLQVQKLKCLLLHQG